MNAGVGCCSVRLWKGFTLKHTVKEFIGDAPFCLLFFPLPVFTLMEYVNSSNYRLYTALIGRHAMQGRGEVRTSESWVFCGRWILTLSLFHHWGARTEKSRDFAAWPLFGCSGLKCSLWRMWSDQCLEVDRCSSADGLECQYHCLESDVSSNRKPGEVTEEGRQMGEFG